MTNTEDVRVSIFARQLVVRDSFVRVLEAAGLQVVSRSSDPQQFIISLSNAHANVAVVDMAGLDSTGPTLLKEAHQFHRSVPLLVLLAGADSASVDHLIEVGAAGYLDTLSTGCDAMIAAIRAVRRGERVFPALFLETFVRRQTERGPAPAGGVLDALSHRERQVLAYVADGLDNTTIAHALGIAERTVKAHVSHLYRKLSQKSRTQLALMARRVGVRSAAPDPGSIEESGE